jgi:hypothetical protein
LVRSNVKNHGETRRARGYEDVKAFRGDIVPFALMGTKRLPPGPKSRACAKARLAGLIQIHFIQESPGGAVVNPNRVKVCGVAAETRDVESAVRTEHEPFRSIERAGTTNYIADEDIEKLEGTRMYLRTWPPTVGPAGPKFGQLET